MLLACFLTSACDAPRDEVHRRAVAKMEVGKYPDKDPPRTDVW